MLGILQTITLLLSVTFIVYVFLIVFPFVRRKAITDGRAADYEWHFFVPCRDEEAVIEASISRARLNFPNAHLWIIDDASQDRTLALSSAFAATDDHVHVVKRQLPNARTGKGDALNDGYSRLNDWLQGREGVDRSKVIVVVLDADGELAAGALDTVASPAAFGDAHVGAVQVTVWMKNRNDRHPRQGRGKLVNAFSRVLIRMQDVEFRTAIAAMQSLRAGTGSVGLGGNGQFTRLSTLDEINAQYGAPWHGSLLEDYELGLHVLMTGARIVHVHETHVSQEALSSFRRLITQRVRWAQGNIQCVRYLKQIFQSRHFSAAAVIEAAYYLTLPFMQLIGIVAFSAVLIFVVARVAVDPVAAVTYARDLWSTLVLFVFFSVGPFFVWGPIYRWKCEPQISLLRAAQIGFMYWLYVYYMYLVIPRAFGRIVLQRKGWAKTRRNAEALDSSQPVALER